MTWRGAEFYAGTLAVVPVTLYWMTISHPAQAARRMVELKGVTTSLSPSCRWPGRLSPAERPTVPPFLPAEWLPARDRARAS